MKPNPRTRIRIFSILILAFALFLTGRLYYLQVVQYKEYANKADHQYVQSSYEYYDRGTVFLKTKDGNLVPGATLKSGFILGINPKLISDPQGTFDRINKIFPLDAKDFLARANKKTSSYEEIAKRVPSDKAEQIQTLKIKGVTPYQERWRFYPGNTMASQAIGFVAYNSEGKTQVGRYGLERYYEDVLGRNNDAVFVNFFAEIFSDIKKVVTEGSSLEGDVVTSIEPSVQAYLEQILADTKSKWSSEEVGAIVMDPMNGQIYAMGTVPSFDLNNFQAQKSTDVYANHMVERVYEMGSIIKPLTVAAGLDSGAILPTTTYNDTGTLTLNKRTISNFDGKARGVVPIQEVLSQSLNTGAAWIERQMGNEAFAKYMLAYGLGEETGIDLPNETHGLVSNLKSPRDIEYATASFGQGVSFTPIETIRALATLGNGGKLVNPRIASQINFKIGGSKKVDPGVERQVLTATTSEAITKMLVTVVDKALLGGTVKMEHYSIAAKTGTAQISQGGGRGYYDDRFLHSFFGYFPAYNPRFIIFLYTVHPIGAKYASETMTPPFMDLAKFLINYYQIPPDR